MADLIDSILKIPLFSGLSRADIAKILGRLEEITFRSGAVFFLKEMPATLLVTLG